MPVYVIYQTIFLFCSAKVIPGEREVEFIRSNSIFFEVSGDFLNQIPGNRKTIEGQF